MQLCARQETSTMRLTHSRRYSRRQWSHLIRTFVVSCILVTAIKTICSHYSTEYGDKYISPSSIQATIRRIVQWSTCHLPRVLINTTTGRLHSRAEQASAFESLPIFNALVSSTTTRIDYAQIKREVRQYFRCYLTSGKRANHCASRSYTQQHMT